MSVTYSFLDVSCGFTGPGIATQLGAGSGSAEEGITIAPTEDLNKMTIGADGSGMHSLHADKSAKITVRLLKNSPQNAVLSKAVAFQRASSASHGQNTITVTNSTSGDSHTLTGVAFRKIPDITYAKDGDVLEWEFDAIRWEQLLGGN
jgi:hypothetical protein